MTTWIYLSPHFDDVALSAGGLVWEQTQRGEVVEIWTICAGDPPHGRPLTDYAAMLHTFWELGDHVPYQRCLEDAAGCRRLGTAFRRFTVPDNIYRYVPGTDEAVVKLPEDNFGPLEPMEGSLIPPVTDLLRKNLPEACELVVPLTLGNHRDHVLTRRAAERLGRPLWHFPDYPYVIRAEYDLVDWIPSEAETYSLKISRQGMQAWQDAIACHRSQITFLWPDEAEMRSAIEDYWGAGQGARLWKF